MGPDPSIFQKCVFAIVKFVGPPPLGLRLDPPWSRMNCPSENFLDPFMLPHLFSVCVCAHELTKNYFKKLMKC